MEQTKRFLNKYKTILVVNADKGSVTVIMSRLDYEDRMHAILNDMMAYRRLQKKNIEPFIMFKTNAE